MLDATLILGLIKTLGGEEGVLFVDKYLTLGGDTVNTLTVLGESDDRRGRTGTLGGLNNTWALLLHHGDIRVGAFYPGVSS